MNNTELKEYIMLMLGAPVISIELDEKQIDLAIEETYRRLDIWAPKTLFEDNPKLAERLIKDGALSYAKSILGRVRGKFSSEKTDGLILSEEAYEEIHDWNAEIEERFSIKVAVSIEKGE